MCTTGAAQPQPAQLQDALEVGEQHLDPLALAARLVEGRRVVEGSGDVAGVLMDVARDLAMRGLRTAPRFKKTGLAVVLAGPVKQCAAVMDFAVVLSVFPLGQT